MARLYPIAAGSGRRAQARGWFCILFRNRKRIQCRKALPVNGQGCRGICLLYKVLWIITRS